MEDGDFISLSERMSHLNPNQSTSIMLESRRANATGNTEQVLVRHPTDSYQQSSMHVSLQADTSVDENDHLERAYTVFYPSTTEITFSQSDETLALPPGSENTDELSAIVVRLARNHILLKNDVLIICLFIRTISSRKKANHFCRGHRCRARLPCLA